MESFGICFFVGDVIIRVGLSIFGPGSWVPTPRANFLTHVCSGI